MNCLGLFFLNTYIPIIDVYITQSGGKRQIKKKGRKEHAIEGTSRIEQSTQNVSMSQPAQNERPQPAQNERSTT